MPMSGRGHGLSLASMDEAEADNRFRRLLAAVESACRMLTAAGEDHWAKWMDSAPRP